MTSQLAAGFRSATETLKQYKRSHLKDEATSTDLTKALYVDPKPGDATLAALKRPVHALVVGRKGTGKSTLFQRFQLDVREGRADVSAYLDVKALFHHAQLKSVQDAVGAGQPGVNGSFALELCLWRSFMALLVADIIEELPKKQEPPAGALRGLLGFLTRKSSEPSNHFTGLADIQRYITQIDIGRFPEGELGENVEEEDVETSAVSAGVNVSQSPGIRGNISRDARQTTRLQELRTRSAVALQQFRIDTFITDLRRALQAAGIGKLHLIIDDYSELPEEAMQLFASCILEPFENLANDIVKLKIAVYPGRFSLGSVDLNRFEVIHLDPHRLFSGVNVIERDRRGMEFVDRIVTNRVQYFCKCPPAEFFRDEEAKIWEALYVASAANPRTLGHLLHFLLENYIEHGEKISVSAIRQAAQAHYLERVESSFNLGRPADQVLLPRGTVNTQRDLLERLRNRAAQLASRPRAGGENQAIIGMRQATNGAPIPVSHFRVQSSLEDFLASLELNGFLSKYAEFIDHAGMKYSVYAFNYGLCQVFKFTWYGTSLAEKNGRFYAIPELDFSETVVGYYHESIEYVCGACNRTEPGSNVDRLRHFQMLCPHCKVGSMTERPTMLNFGQAPVLPKPELVLTEEEFEFVALLGDRKQALIARQMGPELDMSATEVGLKALPLINRGIIVTGKSNGRKTYRLSPNAQANYDKIKQLQAEQLRLEAAT